MKYNKIPHTELNVSEICLGSMTWGEQNSLEEAHQQLDYAISQGINFIDTAEMYSVPGNAKTQGSTETIIGKWLQKTGKRKDIILASKITGPNRYFEHIRKDLSFSKAAVTDALHKSLKRLQTDYLDLYQLHWPERGVNVFGVRDYKHNAAWEDSIGDTLLCLEAFVKEGKIKHIGLSNETPWGVMRYCNEAENGKPKMVTVQNAYSLLNRRDEIGLSEVLLRENIGYLPYSPLGFGQLTGKYLNNEQPNNARVTLFPNYNRYHNAGCFKATEAYNEIAKKYQIPLAQLALAFVRVQPFVTSTIIGATTMEQLKQNLESTEVNLTSEILKDIEAVHQNIPNPAP